MRTPSCQIIATSVFTLCAAPFAPLAAQVLIPPPGVPSRFTVAADLVASKPKGDFANHVDNGWGGNITGFFRLDQAGMFSIRADAGGLEYDRENKRVPFYPYTGRVQLDVRTTNMMMWGTIGPQLVLATSGPVRPYVNAAIGVVSFVTSTSLNGSDDNSEFASTTNKSDATAAYIFGGGIYIPFAKTASAASLNLGARYYHGGTASYLRKGDITDNPDGTITMRPVSSKTDVILWQLGVHVPITTRRNR